ncbi:MAG: hypothetical protein ACRDZ7_03850 [Acidimicrobiia bacterium]
MAVISLPNTEPRIIARWAFRSLLDRLLPELDNDADRATVRGALALDGLHFELLPEDQSSRLARELGRVADDLRLELVRGSRVDPRDEEFAEYLAILEMSLHDLYE